jgi:hypothetical protein
MAAPEATPAAPHRLVPRLVVRASCTPAKEVA